VSMLRGYIDRLLRTFVDDTDFGIGSRTMVSKKIRYTWQQPSNFSCHGHSCRSGALGRSVKGLQFRSCTGAFVQIITSRIFQQPRA